MATATSPHPGDGKSTRWVVVGAGAGGGAAVLTLLLQIAKPEAKPLIEGFLRWGPLFVIVLLGMELAHSTINTWGREFVKAAVDNAKATQANASAMASMADAMQRISQREDERERERELVLDHLAYTTQQILNKVEAIESRSPEKSFAQAAGGPQ